MKLYDNSRTVVDENQILVDFQVRSKNCYQQYAYIGDLQYAEQTRSTLDVFACPSDTTVIFIHGGYWQWCEKSDFAFIAEDVLEQHCQCVLVEYDLAPHSSISQIQTQIGQALDFIAQQTWITDNVILIGHSAGAHLSALHLQHPLVNSAVLLSGIYDLEPIQHTHLNQALNLAETEIQQFSPYLNTQPVNKPYQIVYGEDELDELAWQSRNYYEHRAQLDGDQVKITALPKINHYTILDHFFQHQLQHCLKQN